MPAYLALLFAFRHGAGRGGTRHERAHTRRAAAVRGLPLSGATDLRQERWIFNAWLSAQQTSCSPLVASFHRCLPTWQADGGLSRFTICSVACTRPRASLKDCHELCSDLEIKYLPSLVIWGFKATN